MKGLEIAKAYYEQYGIAMLDSQFKDVKNRIAVGLVGEGSECFGLDDELSQDHDFEPGFCLWITKEDEKAFGFKLERAYAKLPNEFMGYKRQPLNPCGGNRHGVITIEDFYSRFLGIDHAPTSWEEWLTLPSDTIATALNGEVFEDKLGIFSNIRSLLINMPTDLRIKKIAAKLVKMGLAGQYNYGRAISHGEQTAAQLALYEFVKEGIELVFIFNNSYAPYYKLAFSQMRKLDLFNDIEQDFAYLIEHDNSKDEYYKKLEVIDAIAVRFITQLKKENLTEATCHNLDTHAYSVLNHVKDGNLRNINIMVD